MLGEPQFLKHFSFAGDCRHRSEAYATCAGGDTIRCLHTHTSHAPSHTYRIIKMFETKSFPSICTASSTKRRRAVGRHVPDPQVRAFSPLRVHECPRKGLFCATWFPASRLYEVCAKRRLSDDTITRLPPVLTQVPANEIEQRGQIFFAARSSRSSCAILGAPQQGKRLRHSDSALIHFLRIEEAASVLGHETLCLGIFKGLGGIDIGFEIVHEPRRIPLCHP